VSRCLAWFVWSITPSAVYPLEAAALYTALIHLEWANGSTLRSVRPQRSLQFCEFRSGLRSHFSFPLGELTLEVRLFLSGHWSRKLSRYGYRLPSRVPFDQPDGNYDGQDYTSRDKYPLGRRLWSWHIPRPVAAET